MTKKRFTHKKWYDDRELFDGDEPFAIVDVYIQAEAICEKLNELNEEIKVLKQRLKIYKNDGLETVNDLEMAYENNAKALNNIKRLEEENTRLKEENQKLLGLIQKGVGNWSGEKKDEHLAWKRVDVE